VNLTIGTLTIETTPRSLYARLGGLEVFLKCNQGASLNMTSMDRSGGALEVWLLGLYGVVNRGVARPN
jgi:hypothetical protein